jgi:hypothetical protein
MSNIEMLFHRNYLPLKYYSQRVSVIPSNKCEDDVYELQNVNKHRRKVRVMDAVPSFSDRKTLSEEFAEAELRGMRQARSDILNSQQTESAADMKNESVNCSIQ